VKETTVVSVMGENAEEGGALPPRGEALPQSEDSGGDYVVKGCTRRKLRPDTTTLGFQNSGLERHGNGAHGRLGKTTKRGEKVGRQSNSWFDTGERRETSILDQSGGRGVFKKQTGKPRGFDR